MKRSTNTTAVKGVTKKRTRTAYPKKKYNPNKIVPSDIELKFYDNGRAENTISSNMNTGAIIDPSTQLCLNSPIQGDGQSNRDGRIIKMHSLQIGYNIHWNGYVPSQTVPPVFGSVMIAVILDTQTNGAQVTDGGLVFSYGVGSTAQLNPVPFRNLQYSKRFRVLAMKIINPTVGDGSALTNTAMGRTGIHQVGRLYIPLKNMRTTFSANAGTVADIVDNSLHFLAITVDSDVNQDVSISYHSRLRFTA